MNDESVWNLQFWLRHKNFLHAVIPSSNKTVRRMIGIMCKVKNNFMQRVKERSCEGEHRKMKVLSINFPTIVSSITPREVTTVTHSLFFYYSTLPVEANKCETSDWQFHGKEGENEMIHVKSWLFFLRTGVESESREFSVKRMKQCGQSSSKKVGKRQLSLLFSPLTRLTDTQNEKETKWSLKRLAWRLIILQYVPLVSSFFTEEIKE